MVQSIKKENLYFQVLPLDVKGHSVPHLKALTSGIENFAGHRRSSTFKYHHTILNSTLFAFKQAKEWFHVNVASCR